jgi:hypothetical protein
MFYLWSDFYEWLISPMVTRSMSRKNTPKKKCISQLYMKKMQRWSAIQIGIEKNLTSHFKIVRIQT